MSLLYWPSNCIRLSTAWLQCSLLCIAKSLPRRYQTTLMPEYTASGWIAGQMCRRWIHWVSEPNWHTVQQVVSSCFLLIIIGDLQLGQLVFQTHVKTKAISTLRHWLPFYMSTHTNINTLPCYVDCRSTCQHIELLCWVSVYMSTHTNIKSLPCCWLLIYMSTHTNVNTLHCSVECTQQLSTLC